MSLEDNNDLVWAFKVLKCIKCGYVHNTIPLTLESLLNKKSVINRESKYKYRIHNLSVPVCMRCMLEFQAWKRFKSNLFKSILKRIIFIIFLIFVISNIYNNINEILIIISIFGGILIVYYVNLYKKLRKMEYNPKKYMKFDKKGYLYVKPENSSFWKEYIDWLKDTIYELWYLNEFYNSPKLNERQMQFINCIYCGERVKRNDIKCFKCGKLLPLF
ncbi:MAG: hypothetical protein ACFFC9_09420 [Promethearchaeota archaeon]